MIRRILSIAVSPVEDGESQIIALCNDGTLWGMGHTGNWAQFPAIPQDWSSESVEKQWADLVDAGAEVRRLEKEVRRLTDELEEERRPIPFTKGYEKC